MQNVTEISIKHSENIKVNGRSYVFMMLTDFFLPLCNGDITSIHHKKLRKPYSDISLKHFQK